MERDYDRFELVRVVDDFRLIDAESYERAYWRRDGAPLALGYYVASWPARLNPRRFNEDAAFHGPFRERARAEEVLRQKMAPRLTLPPRAPAAAAAGR